MAVSKKIAEQLQDAEVILLKELAQKSPATMQDIRTDLAPDAIRRAALWLSNKKLIDVAETKQEVIILDKLAEQYKDKQLPERRFMLALKKQLRMQEITKAAGLDDDEFRFALGALKQKSFIDINNGIASLTDTGKKQLVKKTLEEIFLEKLFTDKQILLADLRPEEQLAFQNLSKRGLVKKSEIKTTTYTITNLGQEISKSAKVENKIGQLTQDIIKSGKWKTAKFRHYDVEAVVPEVTAGRKHPMTVAKDIISQIFLEMGFTEMKGPWVETAFWCMDSMWIPQDHPARDIQDTFFIDAKGKLPNKKLVAEVKKVQETGGKTGSTGYGVEWYEDVAKQLLLRTHSTATTFRQFGLHSVGKEDCKYFYIAKVFRNEAMTYKCLPEFHHIEGFIVGDNLGVADLMGFIKEFYAKLGIKKIRFKPNYNPYTEPSLQAYYFDERHKKWYALINSGVFRPEALAPYGITKSVIAWGAGFDRVAGILCNQMKLKDLFGATVDLNWLRSYKIMRGEL